MRSIPPADPGQLERMGRHLTRPPMAMGSVHRTDEGLVAVSTPPDPKTGTRIEVLDPIDRIHAVTSQAPDCGQHMVRSFGAYANRIQRRHRPAGPRERPSPTTPDEPEGEVTKARRRSWARLLRKILEVDALLCPTCRVEMRIVSVITAPPTVDRVLAHLGCGNGHAPFDRRAPPSPTAEIA